MAKLKNTVALTVPDTWADSFDQEDQIEVTKIIEWLNATSMTQSWLARLARVSPTTVSQILYGKYPTPPKKQLRAISAAIAAHDNQSSVQTVPYVETSIGQMATLVCNSARRYANFGILCGSVGVGKTAALKQYKEQNAHTIFIEADPHMTVNALLDSLLSSVNAAVPTGVNRKFTAIVEALSDSTHIIIIDEAETMVPQCLHYLRRIRDKAHIGIVLAGTDRLYQLVKPTRGQFDQIRSRVGFWPAPIQLVQRTDIDAIAQAALTDQGELDTDVLDAIWHYTAGSVRMLVENLIPALRDYGLVKYDLSAELVEQVAQKVLFLAPRKA